MSEIERRITTEYPTRYEAFAHPKILFEQKDTALVNEKKHNNGGREFAVYYEPVQKRDAPHLEDGIYAEICSFQGKQYLAEVHATQPEKGRRQQTAHKTFDKYADAVAWMLEEIPKAQVFIVRAPRNRLTICSSMPRSSERGH